jgi:hypothetical protein
MRGSTFAVLAWLCLGTGSSVAQQVNAPPGLKPWEPWVMYGEEFRRCPMQHAATGQDSSAFLCLWPGRIRAAVSSSGGDFSQRWRVYADGWVTLPGDETHWPEDVRVNGDSIAVTAQNGVPRLRLSAGEYTVTGKFTWSRRPESLQLPPSTALVDLSIDGKAVAPVELREDRLWLGAVRTVMVPRALQLQVYRLLEDGLPLQLTTQLHLKVSGDAREELLARALPSGFVAMATGGALPMRFEPDGRLRVQVRSGEHVLTIVARSAAATDSIATPGDEGLWAEEEIWSYRSNDRLRVTAIENVAPIDPAQAGVPAEWRDQPAFRLGRDATIAIAERSRGLSSADANRLSLQRDLWLAFDRTSFTAADSIGGTMQQGWRLDMLSPYRLLNARRDEETMLITDGAQGRTGIEVRTPALQVTTLARVAVDGAQPVTGWDARFENVSTTLHLPPGHRLLAAWGVDDSPDAWLNQWRLLDLFLLMLAAAVAFRLFGWSGAAIAAAAVALTHHEANAPGWLWVNLFVAIAVMRALPAGRLRKWANGYQVVSLAALIFVLIPFAIAQFRLAIHPQLQTVDRPAAIYPMETNVVETQLNSALVPAPFAAPPEVSLEAPAETKARAGLDLAASAPQRLDRYAPGAMLQTGPGIPDWQYLTYRLNWSGPVDAKQTLRLTLLSPFWLSLWRVLGLLLSAALVLISIRRAYGVPRNWRLPPWRPAASAGGLCLLVALGMPPRIEAQTPDTALLTELKKRLSEPAKCAPACAQVVLAAVEIDGDRLDVRLEAHAQASVALGIPQAGPQWIVERVLIDERPSDALARTAGRLQVPLTPGVHRVHITGRIAQADELSLEFPQPPRRIAIHAEGWESSGSSEGRLLNTALQLTRRVTANAEKTSTPQRFAPFVRIHRRVLMNLDWTVSTTVERLAPEEGAFTLRLPLLPGESVLTPGLEVSDAGVLVSMPSGERFAQWESSLNPLDKLQWSAVANQPWVEQWDVIVSPMWHAEFSGTPPIMPADYADGVWTNQFLPRPGESLDLTVVRPVGSAGTTLAVDRVDVATHFAQRLLDTTLQFSYRSSRGGRHDVRIPQEARVQSVMVDDQSLPLRPTDGLLPLTLTPGHHTVTVSFSSDAGIGLASRPPSIDLGAEGTNVRTSLMLPADRWVLFAWGNGVGPAILYWGELVLFAIVAVALGRQRRTPLRTRDWLFLGLGLSTFSWWVLLVFGTWLFVLERRSQLSIQTRWRFNAVQIALALLSLVAVGALISAIPYGLLGQPDMGIRTDAESGSLAWFLDSSASQLPRPGVISVSIWFYKLAMLLWALWLSFALLRWLPWAWRQYSAQGWWRDKTVAG